MEIPTWKIILAGLLLLGAYVLVSTMEYGTTTPKPQPEACWVEHETGDQTGFYCGDRDLAPEPPIFIRWATYGEARRASGH